jgi:ankyrin repeat protein
LPIIKLLVARGVEISASSGLLFYLSSSSFFFFFLLNCCLHRQRRKSVITRGDLRARRLSRVLVSFFFFFFHSDQCLLSLTIERYLLYQGLDANVRAFRGQTPLMRACYHGHLECVRMLLAKGAKVKLCNDCIPSYILSYMPKDQRSR